MGNCFSRIPKPDNKVSPVLRPVVASPPSQKRGKFSFRFGFGRKQNKPAAKKSSTLFVPLLAIEKLQQYNIKQRRSNSVESLSCSTPWPCSTHDDVFSSSLQSVLSGVLSESTLRSLESGQSLELMVEDSKTTEMMSEEAVEPKQDTNAWQAEVDEILVPFSTADELLNELSELDSKPVPPMTTTSKLDGTHGRRPNTQRGRGIHAAEKSKQNKSVLFSDEAL